VVRVDLPAILARLRYRETPGVPAAPGEFRRLGTGWEIYLRAVRRGASQPAQRVRLEVHNDRISRITRNGKPVGTVVLEPEILTSADDVPGEEVRPIRLGDVPRALRNAVLAAEDHRFFEHRGLDPFGLARALWVNVRAGRVVQGGSTITQQLVKSRLLTQERTLGRKLREAWLAWLIEWRYDKAEILEAYLNEIYLGHRAGIGVRGVGAAARAHLGKEVHELTLADAALLAGMIRAPNSTSPLLDRRRAAERRDAVLARMRELGLITEAEHDRARAEPIRPRPAAAAAPGQTAPYFTDHARREAESRLEGGLGGRPVEIVTTLDLTLQRLAEAAVARGLDRLETRRPHLRTQEAGDRLQAALVAIDTRTGQIRAMVGGRDYHTSQFNRATLAARQPGSAFKPFVYLAALRHRGNRRPRLTPASLVEDSPVTLTVKGRTWSPRNYDDRYEGRVTVRRALEASLNAATVRVAEATGLPAVVATATALGIRSEMAPVPALALGAFEVSPLELAGAYLPLASAGWRRETFSVATVQARDGRQLLAAPGNHAERVISAAEAYLLTSLLEGVVRTGTAAGAVDLPAVAGKTGTTNEGHDAWFVGYSSTLLTLVWTGFDSGRSPGLTGTQAALPIWTDFMRRALDVYPAPGFTVPEGISAASIDPTTGKLATPSCPLTAREVFLSGTEPQPCDEHRNLGDRLREWLWEPFRSWFGH
jgi:penicillin-binding protein 1B